MRDHWRRETQDRVLLRTRWKKWEREFLEEKGLLKVPVSLTSGPFGGLPSVVTARLGQGKQGFGGQGAGAMVILLLSELWSLMPDLISPFDPRTDIPGGRHPAPLYSLHVLLLPALHSWLLVDMLIPGCSVEGARVLG